MPKSSPSPVASFTWDQVSAYRLAQHGLDPRLPRGDLLSALARTGGMQAQVMSAAEQALGARVQGITARDVRAALWQERTLVKTWTMRATLHLIAARDFPLYVAARSLDDPRNWVGYFEYYGIPRHQYEAYLAAASEILSDQPMTREQFAAALTRHTGVAVIGELMLSKSWGTPLKPLAWRGDLCFGPNQGQKVTYVNPRQWLADWQPVDPETALREIARRYLRAYGPATLQNFAGWWGLRLTAARKLFRAMEDELAPVVVEGWPAIALRDTLDALHRSTLRGSVRLLPLFDAYVMGIGRNADIAPLLPPAFHRLVYRPQGWVSAVLLVDGRFQGIWDFQPRRGQTALRLRLFAPGAAPDRAALHAEVARIAEFIATPLVLEVEQL